MVSRNIGNQIAEDVHVDDFPDQRRLLPIWVSDLESAGIIDHPTIRREGLILGEPGRGWRKHIPAIERMAFALESILFVLHLTHLEGPLLVEDVRK